MTIYAVAWLLITTSGTYSKSAVAIPMPSMELCQHEAAILDESDKLFAGTKARFVDGGAK